MRNSRARLVLAALAVFGAAVATAPHGNAEPAASAAPATDDAVLRDARSYAADNGVTEAEALRRLALQRPAGELDALLAERESAVFGGVYLQHRPTFRVVVNVTDASVRGRVLATAAAVGLADVAEVRTVRRSLRELEAARSAAHGAAIAGGVRANSEIDVQGNTAVLFVTDGAAAARLRLPEAVRVEVRPTLAHDEADIYAGRSITLCTSGFSVYDAYGTAGMTTAGHCGNAQTYPGSISMTYKTEAWTGAYDVQWHTPPAGHTVRNWAKDTSATGYRSITGQKNRDNQTINEFVCKYGATTLSTCGYIQSKTFNPNTAQNNSATFIHLHRDGVNLSEGGDSGGPYYVGNTAYGIHKCGFGDDSCYMAINYITGLGAVFLHTGCACPILP